MDEVNGITREHIEQKVQESLKIIDDAVEEYKLKKLFALFSGGHDSLVSTHVASQHPAFAGVLHIHTGIGVEQTRQFVRDTCESYEWPLFVYKATEYQKADGTPEPQIYEDLVMEYGFPGPFFHPMMYQRLKERPLQQFIRDRKKEDWAGWGESVGLGSGVRQQESRIRMGYESPVSVVEDQVWVASCFYWSKHECTAYRTFYGLPSNDVVELLCMSGECLCGAYARKGELDILEACYPETAQRLRDLEKRVKDETPYFWGWDHPIPDWWSNEEDKAEMLQSFDSDTLHMCYSCNAKHERTEEELKAIERVSVKEFNIRVRKQMPKHRYVYKIRNKENKMFSSGSTNPTWVRKGHMWTGSGYLKQHLNHLEKKEGLSFYENAEVIKYRLEVEEELGSVEEFRKG